MSSGKSLFLENVSPPRFEIKVSSKGQGSTYICNCLKKREQKAGIIGKMFRAGSLTAFIGTSTVYLRLLEVVDQQSNNQVG